MSASCMLGANMKVDVGLLENFERCVRQAYQLEAAVASVGVHTL